MHVLQTSSPIRLICRPLHKGSNIPHLLVEGCHLGFGRGLGDEGSLQALVRPGQLLLGAVDLAL